MANPGGSVGRDSAGRRGAGPADRLGAEPLARVATPSVTDLVDVMAIRALTDQETYDRGIELAERVRISAFGPLRVAASVEGGETADVELVATPDGLGWTCSAGDASPGFICPHVIAVAVETWRRAPGRRVKTGKPTSEAERR